MNTEKRNPNTMHIDKASTVDMVRMIQEENIKAVHSLDPILSDIALAIDKISERMSAGGRLIYIGAGTSGRLGVLDASECPPTFGVSPELVSGILAGGEACMLRASEGEEDNAESGKRDILSKALTPLDTVVGISASGSAQYVVSALESARELGCFTVAVTSNSESPIAQAAESVIFTDTGAEPITGSTRMKAGTAQKLVLNMLSTCAMIKTGRVCENLMINLSPTNKKLKKRVISIVCELCGCDEESAVAMLEDNDWSIRRVVDGRE